MSTEVFDAELRRRLSRLVSRVCPPWMRDHEDDLVQMALMRLLRSDQEPPWGRALLSRVSYTVVVDEIRRRRRRREVGMSPSMPGRLVNSSEISPETRARGAELGAVLVECLGELLASRRAPVVLYLQGHTVPEIACRLQARPASVRNLVYRGLEDLREALRRRGIEP